MGMGGGQPARPSPEFIKLLKAWGVDFDPAKAVGDIAHARRVQFGGGAPARRHGVRGLAALDRRSIDEKDVLSGGIERLNLASAGFLTKAEGATTRWRPSSMTSPQAMQIGGGEVRHPPDPVALLRAYKPEGKPLMLAARIAGEAKSAFPDGAPKPPKEAKAEDGTQAKARRRQAGGGGPRPRPRMPTSQAPSREAAQGRGRVNVIVVADTDMLADQFWVDVREFLGQQVAIPNASNSAFVVNALDNLSGARGADRRCAARGTDDRPFKLVDELRRDAERRYREKEQALTAKLKEVQDQLAKIESKGGEGGAVILSESDRQTIERFRADMLGVRRELREVKRALRQDIDRLDGWLKFANIAPMPLLIGIGGLAGGLASAAATVLRTRQDGEPNVIQPKHFTALAGVTIVAVLLAAVLYTSANRFAPGRIEGQPLVPELRPGGRITRCKGPRRAGPRRGSSRQARWMPSVGSR